jgi:beta-1,4-mannosyl-glycoprotein beta-1,4-N-acetylglucosaminyltransferase
LVIDCFDFYNELDILEIRLNTLDSLVDYFVISEAPVMFSGLPKALFFEEHKHEPRFQKFSHKIIHQIITDTPDDYINLTANTGDYWKDNVIEKVMNQPWWPHIHTPYGRDTFQKESLIRALTFCMPDDIIILSDADEIANPITLKNVIDNFDPNQIYNLRQKMYNYFFNVRKLGQEEIWNGNMILSYEKFKTTAMGFIKTYRPGIFVDNGGWHYSFMGGREGVLIKMISGNETQLYTEQNKNSIQSNIDNCLTLGHDMFNRPCSYIIDTDYPEYVQNNLERFRNYIK